MDRIIAAIRELRKHFDEAQYPFAQRLGISLRALASYESGDRRPPLPSMMQLMKLADAEGRHDIGDILQKKLENELGGPILRQQVDRPLAEPMLIEASTCDEAMRKLAEDEESDYKARGATFRVTDDMIIDETMIIPLEPALKALRDKGWIVQPPQ